ncbi:MAG TPA: type II toxin-antitoxin system HicB family antitoxin [Caldilineae bacterium]|nr:type II toxin-antitoxin system HicB family antitoxin [Caldilineae bacterium]
MIFSVIVLALPDCFSQGDAFEEAKRNIEEAMSLYLEVMRARTRLAASLTMGGTDFAPLTSPSSSTTAATFPSHTVHVSGKDHACSRSHLLDAGKRKPHHKGRAW